MGLRRLCALIDSLPDESALGRAISPWTQQEHMMATLLEITDFWGRTNAVSLGQPKSLLDDALEFTRPGDTPEPSEPPKAIQTMQSLLAERG